MNSSHVAKEQPNAWHKFVEFISKLGFNPLGLALLIVIAILPATVPYFKQEYVVRWMIMGAFLAAQAIAFDFTSGYINIVNFGFAALLGVWEPLALFLIVMGGIYLGFFTPTEAGAVGATILFLVALFKRSLTWANLVQALQEATRISVMVLFLVAGANVFSYFLALSTIPMQVAMWAK